jgi:uncharacterized membrane protein
MKSSKKNVDFYAKLKQMRTTTLVVIFMSAMFTGIVSNNGINVIENVSGDSQGPDPFGYFWTNSTGSPSVPYTWIDGIAGGTPLGLSDDEWAGPINMGLNFTYYGVTYNEVYIMSNGWISFVDKHDWYQSTDFPDESNFQGVIAPYATDLDPGSSGEIYYKNITGTPNQFVITWSAVPHYLTFELQTFQIILNETNEIWFNYQTLNNPGANVGIENQNSTLGLDYDAAGGNLTSGLSILFDHGPSPYFVNLIPDSQVNFGLASQSIDYILSVHNLGTNDDTYNLSSISVWPITFRDYADTINITNISIANGSSDTFIARVDILGGALPGDVDIANIIATSTNDSLINDSVKVSTGVPIDTPWNEDFEFGDMGGTTGINWTADNFPNSGVSNQTFQSGTYSLYSNGGTVNITSIAVNTSGLSFVEVRFWIRRGDVFSEEPDPGDDLEMYYKNNLGNWVLINTLPGSGIPGEIFSMNYVLPSDAIYTTFQLRFRQKSGSGSGFDFWHIDDVYIGLPPPYRFELSPGDLEAFGIPGSVVDYIYTINNTGANDDTYDLTASLNLWPVVFRDIGNTVNITDISINAQTTSSFIVRVNIPGVASGADIANISISSQNDSSVNTSVLITTSTTLSPPWLDNFEFGTLGGTTGINWTASNSNFAGVGTHTSQSGVYSMYTRGGVVTVTSQMINTSASPTLEVGCWIRRGSDSFSEDPDTSTENLEILYKNNIGTWILLDTFVGSSGSPGEIFIVRYILPADALYDDFQLRFRQTGGSGAAYDYWHIDDVYIREPQQYAMELTPDSQSSIVGLNKNVDYVLTITNWGYNNDTYNLSASSIWPVTFRDITDSVDISQIFVPAGGTIDFIARVSIPPGVVKGEQDLATIYAISQNNITVNDTAEIETVVPITPYWSDELESGTGAWNVWDDGNGTNWELGNPSSWAWGPSQALSPSNCWGTNIAGNYTPDGEATLTTAYVDLQEVSNARLTFFHWYNISGGGNDGGWVEVSSDFGSTWNRIYPAVGTYPDVDWAGLDCYAGSSGGWIQAEFDLSSFWGDIIQIRFHFLDYTFDSQERVGWYIDDVAIFQSPSTSSASALGPTGGPTDVASITISYSYTGSPGQVYLYYTNDLAVPYSWTLIGPDFSVNGNYAWTIINDGPYGWLARTPSEPLPDFSDAPEAGYYIYDINPPQILSTNPIDGATNVYINQAIIITFSEAMDNTSLSYSCNPDPGGWNVTWNNNNHEAILAHANFAFTTAYTFSVTDARDIFGRSFIGGVTPNPWTFSTEATDLRPPTITSTFPIGIDAPAAGNILIVFNESMNTASCESAFSYTDGISTWTIADGIATWNAPANYQMSFNPTSNLNYLTSYTVTVASTASDVNGNDLDGNKNGTSEGSPLDDYVWIFTTQDVPDLSPPTSSVGPLDPHQDSLTFPVPWTASDDTGILYVELYYTTDGGTTWNSWGSVYSSSPISFSSMLEGEYGFYTVATDNSTNYNREADPLPGTLPKASTLVDTIIPVVDCGVNVFTKTQVTLDATITETGSGISTYLWTVISGPGTITLGTPDAETTTASADTEGTYIIRLTVTDNATNSGFDEISFSWDLTPPEASGYPTGSGISVYSDIVVSFNEPVNRSSAESAFTISPSVEGNFLWNFDGSEMTFDPISFLYSNTEYAMSLDSDVVLDLARNQMLNDYTWMFSTGSDVTGTIRGEVLKENLKGLAGATVILEGTDFITETDNDGFYTFSGVPVGNYTILVEKDDYKSQTTTVLVQPYQTIHVPSITMQEKEADSPLLWIILLIVIVIVVVLLLVIYIGKSQKKEPGPYGDYGQYPQPDAAQPPGGVMPPQQYPPEGAPPYDQPPQGPPPQEPQPPSETPSDIPPTEPPSSETEAPSESPQEPLAPPEQSQATEPSQPPVLVPVIPQKETQQPQELKSCINCNQSIPKEITLCPICNWDQSKPLPPPPPGM